MTEAIGKIWQDGELLAQNKQFHESLLYFLRAKSLLIKESAILFDNAPNADNKISKLMGNIMEKLQNSIARVSSILTNDAILALQLPKVGFSKSDVKKAYRAQALKYHPDKNTDCDTTCIFTAIQSAYESLSASTVAQVNHVKSPDKTKRNKSDDISTLSVDVLKSLLKKFGVSIAVNISAYCVSILYLISFRKVYSVLCREPNYYQNIH